MTARIVVDASVVAAALVGTGETGAWALGLLAADHVNAPSLLPVEVANVLRRTVLSGALSDDNATLAHTQLLAMPIDYHAAFEDVGARVWALRSNVRPYDAWYVALAELIDAPLATLDVHLSRASGPLCKFLTPGTWP